MSAWFGRPHHRRRILFVLKWRSNPYDGSGYAGDWGDACDPSRPLPVVTSAEVPWAPPVLQADPNSSVDIARAMRRVYRLKLFQPWFNPAITGLRRYNAASETLWLARFGRPR